MKNLLIKNFFHLRSTQGHIQMNVLIYVNSAKQLSGNLHIWKTTYVMFIRKRESNQRKVILAVTDVVNVSHHFGVLLRIVWLCTKIQPYLSYACFVRKILCWIQVCCSFKFCQNIYLYSVEFVCFIFLPQKFQKSCSVCYFFCCFLNCWCCC